MPCSMLHAFLLHGSPSLTGAAAVQTLLPLGILNIRNALRRPSVGPHCYAYTGPVLKVQGSHHQVHLMTHELHY